MVAEQNIGNAMIYIADKLGMTIEQVYQVYLASQFTLALIGIAEIAAFVIGCAVIVTVCYRAYKMENDSTTSYGDCTLKYYMIALASCVLFGLVLLALYDPIVMLICPQYATIHAMLHDFGMLVK